MRPSVLTTGDYHDVLVLDGEPALGRVESGGASLVLGDVDGERIVTSGEVLERLDAGEAALTVPLPPGRKRLLLVPDEGAVLRRVPVDSFRAATSGDDVREWILRLAQLLPQGVVEQARDLDLSGRTGESGQELEQPTSDKLASPGIAPGEIGPPAGLGVTTDSTREVPGSPGDEQQSEVLLQLEPGQSLRVPDGSACWLRVRSGEVVIHGAPSVQLGPKDDLFPLGAGMTFGAEEASEVEVTLALDDSDATERGLARLHGLVLHGLAMEAAFALEDELSSREQRRALEAERTRAALEGLADVLIPGTARPSGTEPHSRVFSVIATGLGLNWRPSVTPVPTGPDEDPIESLARAAGVRLRHVALRGTWWRQDVGHLIAFARDDGRPLALCPTSRGYEVFDPADDTRRRLTRRSVGEISRDAVMPYRPLPEGPLRIRDLVRFAVQRRRREIALALLTGLAATLLGMATPQATAVLMDHAIPDADRRLLFEIGAGLLAATIGATIFRLSQGIVLLRLGLASEAESQAAIWDRLLRLRPAFLRDYSSGDLQSRTMAVHEIGRQATGVLLTSLFASSLALLNLFLLIHYSAQLALVAVAVAATVMIVVIAAGFLVQKLLRQLMELDGRFFGLVVQLVDGVGKLRIAGAAERAFQHWAGSYGERLKLDDRITRWRDRLSVFSHTLPGTSSAILFLVAHDSVVAGPGVGSLTLGTFLAFTVAFSVFLSGVTSLAETVVSVLDLHARARRIQPLIEAQPEVSSGRTAPGRLKGSIALERVDFRYTEDAPRVLRGIELHAEPGEFVAIVGPSGSGKSTLLRLLLGFEKPTAGHVLYDGRDLESLDVTAVRSQLGVVLQEGRLDAGSIFDNIACGAPLDMDQAWAAIEDAGLARDISEMPMGLHTILGAGGGTISGGQRQRLLIARALARRPRIVLFDEATSSLDNRSQAVVAESLQKLHATRVVIAHRLSTIRRADRIYVLDAGQVVQVGTYDELLGQEDGLFSSMMRRQLT